MSPVRGRHEHCPLSTDFLFARPSALHGLGVLFDLSYYEYNTTSTEEADARAMYSDWHMTGIDLETAIRQWVADQLVLSPENIEIIHSRPLAQTGKDRGKIPT